MHCPNRTCRAVVTLRYAEILQRQTMVCARCGQTIRFSAETVGEFRRALHEYRHLKDRLDKAQEELVATAHTEGATSA